ncbi:MULTISPECIES: SDR family NAD(P)-dependent oxidoreductase [unclassified Rhodococcus (in: high G+C Gram-positive bacteria)]|uniref:SDR family NAD(P)-dependent oxidoreductase n=1 Tax=unclassified Rhodococcus (in: high G+C Gram-positive bacteria) TaxID=192944 RepID=UPI000ABE4CE0|nr:MULTISPECIES: SDR family oxidoreductase [unclassified Rhodococcus (in: high G+C Gram-positive bacteria)]
MNLDLTGRRVFVSGSTRGIGYAVAAACAGEGASVVLNGRTEEKVSGAVARLRKAVPGASVDGISADMCDMEEVSALLGRLGQVDILVNNVGVFEVAPFFEITDEQWSRYFDINVMSAVRLSRALLGGMIDRGWGRIIFTGTESAIDVPVDMVHYGATKATALALGNGLAKLTRGTAVTVNTVLAGATYSDGVAEAVEGIASAQRVPPEDLTSSLVRSSSLIERFIEPEEVADLVTFLASPRSSAINGSAIRADGGVLPTII